MTGGDAGFVQGARVVLGQDDTSHLYTQISEATNPTKGSIARYMSLFKVVINLFYSIL